MKSSESELVSIRDVCFSRGDRVIFDNISLVIPRGKIVAIMGPSGSGKTTLLRMISAQLYPDSGTCLFDDVNVHQLSSKKLFKLRKRMGMLFQSGGLFSNLNVFNNVAFPLREHTRLPDEMIRDLVLMKLNAVGLRGAIDLMPSELSGGMARRVAFARALALDPEMMMFDESFTGQDPITMGVLVKLIREVHDALRLTTVIVSHDVAETASIADYIYLLLNGKIVASGTPAEIQKDTNPAVQQFMQGLPDGVVPFQYPAPEFTEDLLL
ncbi:MAG: ATP-binding cassette domain-containing protein [Pseudomonadota bacterium]|nr:ATP-binding cassette domain-containing protein [Pseudomonadota bacterium]